MPDAPLSLFISYSRTDSAFVDRLEADLRARSFQPWVDRRKLEGGQDWMDELEKAIDRCQIVIVVISPDAVQSKYVRMEYRYGRGQGKPIIPAYCRATPKVPIDLNGLQWVNFQSGYDQGFNDLQIALSRQELAALPPAKPRPASTNIIINQPESVLVTPQPAPPPPAADLNELYRAGVAARAQGNLERTAIFWQQVLDRDPAFGNNTLAPQMQRLMAELHPIRVQRLREQAEQAHRAGVWGQEIGAWQALLGLEANDTQAQQRLPVAQQNQQYAWMYENAQEFAKSKNIPALKEQLGLLWQNAPYYGDPAGLTKLAGLRGVHSKQQRNEFVTSSQGLELSRSFVWVVWVFAFCLSGGAGASIGVLSQSWPWAVGVTAALALLSYLLGYHRTLRLIDIGIILLVSAALVFGATWFLSTFQYDQPQTSHLWFNAVRTLTLRHQIIFGAILGVVAIVVECGLALYTASDEGWHAFFEGIGYGGILFIPGALVAWFIVAILGSVFDWGFGFGYGWSFTLLAGFLTPFIGGAGLMASIYICAIALTNSPEKIHSQEVEKRAGEEQRAHEEEWNARSSSQYPAQPGYLQPGYSSPGQYDQPYPPPPGQYDQPGYPPPGQYLHQK